MARGGINILAMLRRHWDRITHIHLKDVTAAGDWALLGEGVCDIPAVLAYLSVTHYDGWIMLEEEAAAARADPAGAVRRNREWLRRLGY
jgi:sugar phosphate isomerase/epimerase